MRITLHLSFPPDDSHMLLDSLRPLRTSAVRTAASAQSRGTDGCQSARTSKAGLGEETEVEEKGEEEGASVAASLSRGLAERNSHLCERKKVVFFCV